MFYRRYKLKTQKERERKARKRKEKATTRAIICGSSLVPIDAICFIFLEFHRQHVFAGFSLGNAHTPRSLRNCQDLHILCKKKRTVYRAPGKQKKNFPIFPSDEPRAQSTEILPLDDAVSVNSPSTGLHLVPSPLQTPHLSSIASESITQSQPTFCDARDLRVMSACYLA